VLASHSFSWECLLWSAFAVPGFKQHEGPLLTVQAFLGHRPTLDAVSSMNGLMVSRISRLRQGHKVSPVATYKGLKALPAIIGR